MHGNTRRNRGSRSRKPQQGAESLPERWRSGELQPVSRSAGLAGGLFESVERRREQEMRPVLRGPGPAGGSHRPVECEHTGEGSRAAAGERVAVFDTTLRDGEQSAGVAFALRDKVEIASALAAMKVDVIEAGFPASSRGELEAVAAVARAVRGSTVCALARAVPRDVDAAAEALRGAERPRIHVFVNASDIQLVHQLRRRRDEVLAMVEACVRRARGVTNDVELSPMDATRADSDFLAQVAETAVEAGATTLNLPDTVGCATPGMITRLVREVRALVPAEIVLSFHGQDDLGLATANALAAVEAGARQVELAVNGIGERAGNTSFEEVVMALRVHGPALGVHTTVDSRGIHALSKLVEQRSGLPVPPNKAIVGRNAFRHASGIHQDGVLKQRETYEVIDPAEIGHPSGSEIVLGKLSGRAGFAARVRALGIDLPGDAFDRAFARFQSLAPRTREVPDITLRTLCAEAQDEERKAVGS